MIDRRPQLVRVIALAIALAPAGLAAQFGEDDSAAKIKRIVDEVAKEMAEIDRLLLQSSSPGKSEAEAAQALARNIERIDKLLEQTSASQTSVVRGIDELIKEIEKMGGEGMSSESSPKPSPGQRQQRPGEREPSQPMEEQQQDRQGNDPQNQPAQDQKQDEEGGRNAPSSERPEDPKEKLSPPTDVDSWGFLPKSMDFLKHRGGGPTVPERYRKFREAFLKQGVRDKNK